MFAGVKDQDKIRILFTQTAVRLVFLLQLAARDTPAQLNR